MAQAAIYGVGFLGVVLGIAGLLAGEFFHGVGYLVYVGGVVALLAVGLLTAGIHREGPPESAGH